METPILFLCQKSHLPWPPRPPGWAPVSVFSWAPSAPAAWWPCCCCCWAAEPKAQPRRLQVNLLGEHVETYGHTHTHIYIFVVKQLGNSEPVCGRWGKFLGCLWSLTSGNNFLGAIECDESGGCLHVTPGWGSWCVRQFGFRVDIVAVRFGGDLPVPISRYFFWCHAMKIM